MLVSEDTYGDVIKRRNSYFLFYSVVNSSKWLVNIKGRIQYEPIEYYITIQLIKMLTCA